MGVAAEGRALGAEGQEEEEEEEEGGAQEEPDLLRAGAAGKEEEEEEEGTAGEEEGTGGTTVSYRWQIWMCVPYNVRTYTTTRNGTRGEVENASVSSSVRVAGARMRGCVCSCMCGMAIDSPPSH